MSESDPARENVLHQYGEAAARYYDDHFSGRWPIEFDGMNCNDFVVWDEDYCDGWDGVSRHCNCGSRRVGWVWEENENSCFSSILYAEAY